MNLTQFARTYLTKYGNVPVVVSNASGAERLQITTVGARYQVSVWGVGEAHSIRCSASVREGGRAVGILYEEMTDESFTKLMAEIVAFEFAIGAMKQSEAYGGEMHATIRQELAKAAGVSV